MIQLAHNLSRNLIRILRVADLPVFFSLRPIDSREIFQMECCNSSAFFALMNSARYLSKAAFASFTCFYALVNAFPHPISAAACVPPKLAAPCAASGSLPFQMTRYSLLVVHQSL